jgi:uncharacterized damage-inducible protein DinB
MTARPVALGSAPEAHAVIDATYVVTMASYNRWQNDNLFGAADALSDAARKQDRGAFFGSIHRTLNHILWADEVWMGRLAGRAHPATPFNQSADRYPEWNDLRAARAELDADIATWAGALDPAWLTQSPAGAPGGRATKAQRTHAFLVVHMFNHQTHHRGQVHAMLTAAGARPGDTDLLKMGP